MYKKVNSKKSSMRKYISTLILFAFVLIFSNVLAANGRTNLIAKREMLNKSLIFNEIAAQKNNANKDTTKSDSQEKIYDILNIEELPSFPGGIKGWSRYLQENLTYPDYARRNNITGRVIVSFVISQTGEISDVRLLRGIGGGADQEAVRVVRNSPKWTPGRQNGKFVRVAYTIPISFQLAPQTNEENRNPFRRDF